MSLLDTIAEITFDTKHPYLQLTVFFNLVFSSKDYGETYDVAES